MRPVYVSQMRLTHAHGRDNVQAVLVSEAIQHTKWNTPIVVEIKNLQNIREKAKIFSLFDQNSP